MTAKRQRLSTAARQGSMVTVILQPQNTEYKVYKAVLAEHSAYFKKALTGAWKEADERKVRLEDIEDHTFNVFVDWMYTGHDQALDLTHAHWHPSGESKDAMRAIMQAYVLGDRFQALEFKAYMLCLMIACFNHEIRSTPDFTTITYAFANLPQDDIILQLLADLHFNRYECREDSEENKEAFERLPRDFLVRVVMSYGKKECKRWKIVGSVYQLKGKAE